jgi:hypothetical protein
VLITFLIDTDPAPPVQRGLPARRTGNPGIAG